MPTLLVILNDIMAYLSGFFFGRTPLTSLSPKKTWEGFIGAFFSTMAVSWFLGLWLAKFKWMTCPRTDLTVRGWLDCELSPTYQVSTYTKDELLGMLPEQLAPLVSPVFPWGSVDLAPIQLHALVLSMFASIIAPFGGFFASGFKRAFKVKDFGDSIPGHGGLTDRMDCQVIMAVFANIYYNTAVKEAVNTVASVLQIIETLSPESRVELYASLGNLLVGEGLMSEASLPKLSSLT
jgi:phosphatidate cytidylyltransferase